MFTLSDGILMRRKLSKSLIESVHEILVALKSFTRFLCLNDKGLSKSCISHPFNLTNDLSEVRNWSLIDLNESNQGM